jgi:hypothetical protein
LYFTVDNIELYKFMIEHFDPRIKFCQEVDDYKKYPVGTRLKDGGVVINSEATSHGMPNRIAICYSEAEGQCSICGWRINCGYFRSEFTQQKQ